MTETDHANLLKASERLACRDCRSQLRLSRKLMLRASPRVKIVGGPVVSLHFEPAFPIRPSRKRSICLCVPLAQFATLVLLFVKRSFCKDSPFLQPPILISWNQCCNRSNNLSWLFSPKLLKLSTKTIRMAAMAIVYYSPKWITSESGTIGNTIAAHTRSDYFCLQPTVRRIPLERLTHVLIIQYLPFVCIPDRIVLI